MKTTDSIESKHKKTIFGVIYTQDGSVIRVKLNIRHGRSVVEAVNSWSASNVLKTALMLSEGTVAGLCAEWRRTAPNSNLEPPVSEANAGFNPYLHTARAS